MTELKSPSAYVGVSRCTSLEGLEVLNFSPGMVFAHEEYVQARQGIIFGCADTNLRSVTHWYKTLSVA